MSGTRSWTLVTLGALVQSEASDQKSLEGSCDCYSSRFRARITTPTKAPR
jgi:hypothetical protein